MGPRKLRYTFCQISAKHIILSDRRRDYHKAIRLRVHVLYLCFINTFMLQPLAINGWNNKILLDITINK